ncbi:MAG: hypothetical protein IPH94_03390 [Saprospiraceae bacterium]|nr:hypothetical protein [Saprospiraceae bacterium]MBK8109573.1 hypothetical protein [Saprospiraceae bacterium]
MKTILAFVILIITGSGVYYYFHRETQNNISEILKQTLTSPEPAYLVYGNDSMLNVISSIEKGYKEVFYHDHDWKYLLPYDGAILDLNQLKTDTLLPRKKLIAEIYTEGKEDSINLDSTLLYLDQAMKSMYTGFALEVVNKRTIDCSSLQSTGEINADNIRKHFEEHQRYTDNLDLHIYMVSRGDFLASVNALCVPTGEQNIILGDLNLLHNPILLIHEIFHAKNLRHLEIRSCKSNGQNTSANVMDFKTKGCSHYLTIRQILLAHLNEFIPVVKEDVSFPACATCNQYPGDDLIFEDFANSIEGAAIELPVNGDHEAFKNYVDEISTGLIPGPIRTAIYHNYKTQALAIGVASPTAYANQMIAIHRKMRQRNLARWAICNYQKMFHTSGLYGNTMKLDSILMKNYLDSLNVVALPPMIELPPNLEETPDTIGKGR